MKPTRSKPPLFATFPVRYVLLPEDVAHDVKRSSESIFTFGPIPNEAVQAIRRWMAPAATHAVIMTTQLGRLVGFARYDVAGDAVITHGVWVDVRYQGKGHATRMLDLATASARRLYMTPITTKGRKFAKAYQEHAAKLRGDSLLVEIV